MLRYCEAQAAPRLPLCLTRLVRMCIALSKCMIRSAFSMQSDGVFGRLYDSM